MSIKLVKGYSVPKEGEGQYNGLGHMAFRAFYGDAAADNDSLTENALAGELSPTFSPIIELGDEPYKKWSPFYGLDGVKFGPNSPQYGVMQMTGGDVRGCPYGNCGQGLGTTDEAPSRVTWFLLGLVAGGMLWPKLATRF